MAFIYTRIIVRDALRVATMRYEERGLSVIVIKVQHRKEWEERRLDGGGGGSEVIVRYLGNTSARPSPSPLQESASRRDL